MQAPPPTATPRVSQNIPTPDAGLTAQHEDVHQQAFAWRRACLAEVAHIQPDPRPLKRGEFLDFETADALTLSESVSKADLIVLGTVQSFKFDLNGGADATVAVEMTLKGKRTSSIDLRETVEPECSDDGIDLGYPIGSPLVFPGDRVVLLLKRVPGKSAFWVENGNGTYVIDGQQVVTTELNPFRDQLRGLSESSFLYVMRAVTGHR